MQVATTMPSGSEPCISPPTVVAYDDGMYCRSYQTVVQYVGGWRVARMMRGLLGNKRGFLLFCAAHMLLWGR